MDRKVKNQALRRLKIIEGQIRGLQRLVEKDQYCIDTIHQSLAVREALSSFENLMLENHLATHVIDQMKRGKDKKAIEEILSVYKLRRQK